MSLKVSVPHLMALLLDLAEDSQGSPTP